MILSAMLILCSFIPMMKVYEQCVIKNLRIAWGVLVLLIVIFFSGYMLYTVIFWDATYIKLIDFIAPSIFIFGSIFVFTVCIILAIISKNMDRISKLETENITDSLMGIYNRRYFDKRSLLESARARREKTDLTMMIIDIDDFKQVNDVYGHPTGDEVLKMVAKTIRGSLRDFDLIFRYGGEELAILLPGTKQEKGVMIAERLCQWIENRTMVSTQISKSRADILVTISIGISTYQPAAENIEDTVYRADQALYDAKNNGKNQVAVSPTPKSCRKMHIVK